MIAERTDQALPLATVREGPLYFYSATGASANLDGWYAGRAVFLTLPGPSLAGMDLDLLRRPGVMTWGINNSWATFRPRLWTCVDPPGRFCDQGWADPAITKLVPLHCADQPLRYRDEISGAFKWSHQRVRDMPAVWFWQRNGRFEPADFFLQASVCWGQDGDGADPLGIKGMRSTMLATLRLIHAVGFRTVYLCGCDFKVTKGGRNYSFDQRQPDRVVDHNARQFRAMTMRLEALAPYCEAVGLRLFNCTPGSALTLFPQVPLADAVAEATADCGAAMDPRGWYGDEQETRREMEWMWGGRGSAGAD